MISAKPVAAVGEVTLVRLFATCLSVFPVSAATLGKKYHFCHFPRSACRTGDVNSLCKYHRSLSNVGLGNRFRQIRARTA